MWCDVISTPHLLLLLLLLIIKQLLLVKIKHTTTNDKMLGISAINCIELINYFPNLLLLMPLLLNILVFKYQQHTYYTTYQLFVLHMVYL